MRTTRKAITTELNKLGYGLESVKKDFLGRPARYRTVPLAQLGGGANCYFQSLAEVARYATKVAADRAFLYGDHNVYLED